MPDKDVKTIKDLIYYQYSKIIAKSAFDQKNGTQAKKSHYGFIKKTFLELKSGKKSISNILREDWQVVEASHNCAYCGSTEELEKEHIVPRSLKVRPECAHCDKIQAIHNQVRACKKCNRLKKTMGLYHFFQMMFPANPKYYDSIPPLVEKKYLKTILNCHECANTTEATDLDGDGKLTVLDIDVILKKPK